MPEQSAAAEVKPVATIVTMPKNTDQIARIRAEPQRIGDQLRQERLKKKEDIYRIAEYLCIKPAFLIALENSQYNEFPADTYVIGFLRSYANLLGLDGKQAVETYRQEMAGHNIAPILAMPTPLTEGRTPSGVIMVGAVIALLAIYALWYSISSANRTQVAAPPLATTAPALSEATPPEAPAGAPAPKPASPPVAALPESATPMVAEHAGIPPAAPGIVVTAAAPVSAAARDDLKADISGSGKDIAATKPTDKERPAQQSTATAVSPANDAAAASVTPAASGKQIYGNPDEVAHVMIRATQTSWINVTDSSGKVIFDHVLKSGDVYKAPNQPGLNLATGNGDGLQILVDNVEAPKVATGSPHVVRGISLDPAHLNAEGVIP